MLYSFQLQDVVKPHEIYFLRSTYYESALETTFKPAAFLRCGSRFSGSPSGIEP